MNLIALILLAVAVYLGCGVIVYTVHRSANDDVTSHRAEPETHPQRITQTATLIAVWPIVLYVLAGEIMMDDDADDDRPTHLDGVSDR